MSQRRQSTKAAAKHRVAQKYRLLGYEVKESPEATLLPDFMRGISPDILARSRFDNVVVEIKENSALKGSNDLIGIAQKISEHPEWRFELVVLPAKEDQLSYSAISANYDNLLEKIHTATNANLSEVVYIYLVNMMNWQSHMLAKKYNLKTKGKTDRDLVLELDFKGVLPDEITQKCLSVLVMRDKLAHNFNESIKPTSKDLSNLLQLCRNLEDLT